MEQYVLNFETPSCYMSSNSNSVLCLPGRRPGCSNTKEGDYYQTYIPLYKAAQRGDWESADAFFKRNEDALTAKINEDSETALHVAIGAGTSSKSISFMKMLVYRMPPEALEYRDKHGRTPFDAAVAVGNTDAVKWLWWVGFNSQYRRAQFWSALYTAAVSARKDILLFLLDVSEYDKFSQVFPNEDSAAHFLILVIASGYYGEYTTPFLLEFMYTLILVNLIISLHFVYFVHLF